MSEPKRILIFNVNWMGDVLFSTATIRNIRYAYPDSYIACIIPPRCLPILEGNPHCNEIIIFDERGAHKSPWGKFKFIRYLRKKKFDIAFLLHRSLSRALIVALAGIPERIGHYTKKRAFLLTKSVCPPPINEVHRIDYYLDVIKGAGIEILDRFPEIFFKEEDMRAVESFLAQHGVSEDDFLVGINPGGNWNPKRWPVDNFTALAQRLSQEYRATIIITGSAADLGLSRIIAEGMKIKPIIAAGALTIKQFAVLVSILNIFVSADSGPLHIANAVGARSIIALFGPTDPRVTGPVPDTHVVLLRKGTGCLIPCYEVGCRDNRCMQAITVDDVMEEIREVTQKPRYAPD